MARYYAMSWLYGKGITTDDSTGTAVRAANYFSFPTLAARARWCAGGAPWRGERDFREPLVASDRHLRATLRRDEDLVVRAESCTGESYESRSERDAKRALETT
jgi:hypothetical protein